MSSLSLPPEEELALLRAEVASLRQELEQVRKVERAGGRDERGGNGNKASTRSCNIVNNGGGGGNAIDDESLPPPPQRAGDRAFWEADHPLSTPQIERYCRQMLLPWFGPEGEGVFGFSLFFSPQEPSTHNLSTFSTSSLLLSFTKKHSPQPKPASPPRQPSSSASAASAARPRSTWPRRGSASWVCATATASTSATSTARSYMKMPPPLVLRPPPLVLRPPPLVLRPPLPLDSPRRQRSSPPRLPCAGSTPRPSSSSSARG